MSVVQRPKVSLIAILAFTFQHLSSASASCSTELPPLLVRNGSAFTISCRNPKFTTLSVLWQENFIYECQVNPSFSMNSSSLKKASMVGSCSPSVDVNVTLHSADLDTNYRTVYCDYSRDCSDIYTLLVYDAGSLKLETTYEASGVSLTATNSSLTPTAAPMVLSPSNWSSAQFSFSCSFDRCGSTNMAALVWYTTTDAKSTVSGLVTNQTASGTSCEYSGTLLEASLIQKSGSYQSASTYIWKAASFLQAAFNASPSISVCDSPAAAQTVTVRVGCVSQFQVYSSNENFMWTNDAVNDAVWQTIVFSCPAKVAAAASVPSTTSLSQSELIGIVVGIIVAAIVVTAVAFVIIRARRSRSTHQAVAQDDHARAASANNNGNDRFEKSSPITA